jgi:hypothetical protein
VVIESTPVRQAGNARCISGKALPQVADDGAANRAVASVAAATASGGNPYFVFLNKSRQSFKASVGGRKLTEVELEKIRADARTEYDTSLTSAEHEVASLSKLSHALASFASPVCLPVGRVLQSASIGGSRPPTQGVWGRRLPRRPKYKYTCCRLGAQPINRHKIEKPCVSDCEQFHTALYRLLTSIPFPSWGFRGERTMF